jgi:hypothetical protein
MFFGTSGRLLFKNSYSLNDIELYERYNESMNKRISRKLIEQFMVQKKLRGIASFLSFVAAPDHAKIFVDYANRHNCLISSPDAFSSKILFHGSQQYAKQLIASRKEKSIYATDDPNYAIFLAILNLKNATAGVFIKRGKAKLTVDLAFVNGPSSFKNGWVHVIAGQHFKRTKNHEYISKQSVDILFSVTVVPADLTVPVSVQL